MENGHAYLKKQGLDHWISCRATKVAVELLLGASCILLAYNLATLGELVATNKSLLSALLIAGILVLSTCWVYCDTLQHGYPIRKFYRRRHMLTTPLAVIVEYMRETRREKWVASIVILILAAFGYVLLFSLAYGVAIFRPCI